MTTEGPSLLLMAALALMFSTFRVDFRLRSRIRSFSFSMVALGTGYRIEKGTNFDAKADAKGFIVVYPDGIGHNWNDGRGTANPNIDDVGFIRQLIGNLELRLPINSKARSMRPASRMEAISPFAWLAIFPTCSLRSARISAPCRRTSCRRANRRDPFR